MSMVTNPITIDPDIQGGTPCFAGTRVPVRTLFDALMRGRTTHYFLAQFPSVSAEQVQSVLERAGKIVAFESHAA